MRKLLLVIVWIAWTLACVYGTYNNTVKHAELISHSNGEYEILYHNTGDIFNYTEN